jgi:uncharacterized protein YegL
MVLQRELYGLYKHSLVSCLMANQPIRIDGKRRFEHKGDKEMGIIQSTNSSSGYTKLIGTSSQGLIMILLDQSGSMSDDNKAKDASKAVNRVIYEIMLKSRAGETIKPRCYIGVIGYGASVYPIVGGTITEVAAKPLRAEKVEKKVDDGAGGLVAVPMDMPVWVEPRAENGTPMAEAFEQAYSLIEKWVQSHPDSFPPIVMNVTDGEPNDPSRTKVAAHKVMNLGTSDGKALVFNAHITGSKTSAEIQLPPSVSGILDQYAKFLFDISSEIPPRLMQAAQEAGLMSQPNARGLIFNATTETLIKLLTFGSSIAR